MIIAEEKDLLDGIATNLPVASQVIVFAPHPDDEVFGCGGVMSLLNKANTHISVEIVTDGALGGDGQEGLKEARAQESCEALKVLDIPAPTFWQLPDRGLVYGEVLVCRMIELIESKDADLIFVPSPAEFHPDHQALAFAGLEAMRRLGGERKIAFYEIGAPLATPNLLIDISQVDEQKHKAMSCFSSQLNEQPYLERISGLNRFRAFNLGACATSAEAFVILDADVLDSDLSALFGGISVSRHKLGFASSGKDVPLVSLVVRSMDRASLSETLDSIALQTYPNIEVVLVNAKGGAHSDCGPVCGHFPVRLVNDGLEPLKRPQAANKGLVACQGQYIGFLDDDDTIDPNHVTLLVDSMQSIDDKAVVYAGTRCCDRSDPQHTVTRIFAEPDASFAKLLLENFIPIHSVLFPAQFLDGGGCFDEKLLVYEDWDFWLQLANKHPFVFVDEVTSTYFTGGSSGVAPNAQQHEYAWNNQKTLLKKWLKKLSPEELRDIGILYRKTYDQRSVLIHEVNLLQANQAEASHQITSLQNALEHKNLQLEQKDLQLEQKKQQLEQKELHLEQLNQEHHLVITSRTWRYTKSVRDIVRRFKKIYVLFAFWTKQPEKIKPSLERLYKAWRLSGMVAVKQLISEIPFEMDFTELWARHQRHLVKQGYKEIKEAVAKMTRQPLISILMPTFNTQPEILRETLDSVLAQIYPNWQLCVVDDASTHAGIRDILTKYAQSDRRIKLHFCDDNGGVSKATNYALDLAEGEYVVLLDHDDVLERHALFRVAESIVAESPDFIYSDEVMLTEDGKEVLGYLCRPSFSLEYLRSHPYIVHMAAIRTELLRSMGGLDTSLQISQDYDLFLRLAEKTDLIVHIPEILYRWRQVEQSSGNEKRDLVMSTSKKVIQAHLQRCGEIAVVENGRDFNFFDVRSPLQKSVNVAIIIPTKNHGALVRQCIESIDRTVQGINYDIIVVDHASDDPASIEYFNRIKEQHKVIRYEGPFNFSAINNWAVHQLQSEYTHYLFLNNDIEANEDGWLERMLELGQKKNVGIVGAALFYPDIDIYQHAGVCVGLFGAAEHYGKFHKRFLDDGSINPGHMGLLIANHEVSAVTAACLLMSCEAFKDIGGYDEDFSVGFGDVDLCLRTRKQGWQVLYCPGAALIHHESFTRGKSNGEDPHPEDSALFQRRWKSLLASGDPHYNPNLSPYSTRWELFVPLPFNVNLNRRVVQKKL